MTTTATKYRPILFSAPMVRALLAGQKTQTRRLLSHRHIKHLSTGTVMPRDFEYIDSVTPCGHAFEACMGKSNMILGSAVCPYGVPGDRLWCKHEHWKKPASDLCRERVWDPFTELSRWKGDASSDDLREGFESFSTVAEVKKCPSIHLPRWASRITLEVTGVRVERVQDISEADAVAEGVETHAQKYGLPEEKLHGSTPWYRYDGAPCAAVSAAESFRTLWESINGAESWKANPWVWVLDFRRVEQ